MHGMSLVKLATMLMLVGGVPQTRSDASRSDIHLLLVGDPGTGKSQMMKWAAALSPRSVVTSGRGSTAAGLTATAVRSGQDWSLEAGAMVLADGGLCCIDEFNGLRDGAQTVMHEAMEQQTVSVAKAGLITSLNTRASVFAACNPKGGYDARSSLAANVKLGGPLLSRFDIVLVLRDVQLPSWDACIADHLLGLAEENNSTAAQGWDLGTLKQYVAWAKGFQPQMSSSAENVILAYYRNQRQACMRDTSRTTARLLQSLIRISQAHARLMAKSTVDVQDAVAAVVLVDAARLEAAFFDINPMLASAPDDPDAAHETLCARLRQKLEIEQ